VEKAEVGMILAEPVMDRRGRLLMPAGRELLEKHLDALPMWGISHIQVEGDGMGDDEELLEEMAPWAVAQAGEEMVHRFLHAGTAHPVMKELSALALKRRALELQQEKSHGD
jgi:hypothetical protein